MCQVNGEEGFRPQNLRVAVRGAEACCALCRIAVERLAWYLQLFRAAVNQTGGKGSLLVLYRRLHYKELAAKRCGFVQI